jgi:SAM-dependent methyltransferase
MDNCIQEFITLLNKANKTPFVEREFICKRIQFLLEDYAKRFPAAAINVYKNIFGALSREIGFSAKDKYVLEIGPGFSMGVAFLVGISGAEVVCAVDAYPHPKESDNDFILSMYNALLNNRSSLETVVRNTSDEDFTNQFSTCISKDEQGQLMYRREKLSFFYPYYVEKLPFRDSSFDCVYSSATFEHFKLPQQAVQELFRVTKAGGVHCHIIDLRDHRDFNNPMEFLTLDDSQWLAHYASIRSTSYSHTNRLRSSQIVHCFEQAGFTTLKVLPFEHCTVKPELRARLHADFKGFSDEELGIMGCKYIFRKQEK